MRRDYFETLIRKVTEELPGNIKEAMENVAFVIDAARGRLAKGTATTGADFSAPRQSIFCIKPLILITGMIGALLRRSCCFHINTIRLV